MNASSGHGRCVVRSISRFVVLLAVVLCAPAAGAAPVVGAAGRVAEGVIPEAHGWLVVPAREQISADADGSGESGTRRSRPGWVLLHLPPREASLFGGVPGLGHRSRFLEDAPIGIAASGRDVYLLFDGRPADARSDAPQSDEVPSDTTGAGETGSRRYSVRSITAWPTAVSGNWADRPVGRMESLAPLVVSGDVIGFAGTEAGPAALVRTGASLAIARYTDGAWRIDDLPDAGLLAGDAVPALIASPRRLAVVGRSAVLIESRESHDGNPDGPRWTRRGIRTSPGERALGLVGDRLVTWVPGASADAPVSIELVGPDRREPLASVEIPGLADFVGAVVFPDANGRLILAVGRADESAEDPGARATAAAIRYALIEISLSTGDVLYNGPVDRVAPVSREEFLLLAASMIVMMVVSLVIVLRPVPGESELTLPAGCALASPGRRFAATVLDLALCTMIVSRVSGVPFSEIVGLEVLIATDKSWLTLPGVLALGLVYATLTETIFAGTFGKLVLGCRVVRASRGGGSARRAGFVRTLARNGVKWVLPPAASLALIEPTGRHRGDFLAGVLVVVPLADENGGPEDREERSSDEAGIDDPADASDEN